MTGKTKTVFTLLAPGMVTLGMMCLVITAITTLVLKVLGIPRSLIIMFYEPLLADSAPRHLTTLTLNYKWFKNMSSGQAL